MKAKEQALIGQVPISAFILIYIVYLYLTGLDILTTYWVSPNLKYEYNPIIVHTQMDWSSIFVFSISGVTLLYLIFIISLSTLYIKFKFKTVSLLGISLFICHLSYSTFTIANNILSGIYIYKTKLAFMDKFANWYINKIAIKHYFYETVFLLNLFLSILFVFLIFSKVKSSK